MDHEQTGRPPSAVPGRQRPAIPGRLVPAGPGTKPPAIPASSGSYELVTLLALGLRSMIDQLHQRLGEAGVSDVRPAYGFAFSRLAPDGATGQQLADHLGVTRSAASQLVDEMEERGYVRRLPHPTDRRGKLVVLTEAGWQCIRLTEAILADLETGWREVIGDQQMTSLIGSLRQLSARMPHRAGRGLRPIW